MICCEAQASSRRRRYVHRVRFRLAVVVCSLLALAVAASADAATSKWILTARSELSSLQVKPIGSMNGYSRAQFGPAWADVDRNGCDTRDDILQRDLSSITYRSGSRCLIAAGTLRDPYTGKTIHFVRGVKTSSAIQIDHVVALGDAWVTGASSWSAHKRLMYANDPTVLLAVDGPQNEAKGDDDAASWEPPNKAFDCAYVARQITIKYKYKLWVTSVEKTAMVRTLLSCPANSIPEPAANSAAAVPAGPVAAAPPAPKTSSSSSTVWPGAYCARAGATGKSKSGTVYVCKTKPGDTRLRWRRQ